MSAERNCFKQMNDLIERRRHFEHDYFEEGRHLVQRALTEFMDDHPEVAELKFNPTGPLYMAVGLSEDAGKEYEYKDLVESNPKLAVCLAALHSNFTALIGVVRSLFSDEVRLTHDNIR